MTETELPKPEKAIETATPKKTEAELMAKDLSFGLQQTAACFSTDFIDPIVSKKIQDHFGVKEHDVTHAHVWGGEVIGDLAALPIYLTVKKVFRAPLDSIANWWKDKRNDAFEKSGTEHLKHWAEKNHISPDSEQYRKKLEEYKDFQAHGGVDSVIVAGAATSVNVLSQKYVLKNHQPLKVIGLSKIAGAAITMATMLGLRKNLPHATQSMDEEMSDRYFLPVFNHVAHQMGFKTAPTDDVEEKQKASDMADPAHKNYADPAVAGTVATVAYLLGREDGKFSLRNPKHLAILAGGGTVAALGMRALTPETMQHLNNELNNRYLSKKTRANERLEGWKERVAVDPDSAKQIS